MRVDGWRVEVDPAAPIPTLVATSCAAGMGLSVERWMVEWWGEKGLRGRGLGQN